MGSGMNMEQAKEYAKTMTYSRAVSNCYHAKGIMYRKATMIKLRELAEIADRLDRKTEPNSSEKPNNCKTCRHWKYIAKEWQCEAYKCQGYEPKDEPQTERSK